MHTWLPWLALLPLARAEPPVARGPARLEGQGPEAGGLAPLPFGKPVRDAYFQFGEGFMNFNHGGFGATALPVRRAMEAFTDDMEANPTQWFSNAAKGYHEVLSRVRPALARLIGANESDVAFLDNASSGLNAVLRSVAWTRGDILLFTEAAYMALKNVASWLEKRYGVRCIVLSISYPVSGPEAYLGPMRRALDSLSSEELARLRLASFDHISSYPAVVLPVADLARLVKERTGGRALVLVDGAHGLGQVALDLGGEFAGAGVDFYVADGHKWLMSPHGSALLWAASQSQALLEPGIISSENGLDTDFHGRFDYIGTRDYTPWCAMGAALEFRSKALGGEENVRDYIHNLAWWAGQTLAERFQTEVLAPEEMTAAITNVRLPIPRSWPAEDRRRCASGVDVELLSRYNSQVVSATLSTPVRPGSAAVEETHWLRLSAQVYLGKEDFLTLGGQVLEIIGACRGRADAGAEEMLL